jgi:hypothetical protein
MQPIVLNKIIQQAKSGNYTAHDNDLQPDCVIALAFGFQKIGGLIQPGLSNKDLAAFIYQRYRQLPMILQFEIADAMPPVRVDIYRIDKHRRPNTYLDTREVVEQAKKIMDENDWTRAVIVGHPNHMPRIDAVCQKLGISTIVPVGLSSIRFDLESEQEWTRSAALMAIHEEKAINSYDKLGML